MTTKKTPQEIAEKAAEYAYVDGGPSKETIAAHARSELLDSPHKSVRSIFSVERGNGYAAGYRDSQDEQPNSPIEPSRNIVDHLAQAECFPRMWSHETRVSVVRDLLVKLAEVSPDLRDKLEQANIGIVIKPPPPPPPPAAPMPKAPDELITEIDDETAKAAAEYANTVRGDRPKDSDLWLARDAMKHERGKVTDWAVIVHDFVAGAHWQLAMVECHAAGEDPPNIHELREENERLRRDIEATAKQAAEWRDQLEKSDKTIADLRARVNDMSGQLYVKEAGMQKRGYIPTPEPAIVFRDDEERDYWSAISQDRNHRNGDEGPEAIGAFADRMVQVRRARMPTIDIKSQTSPRPIYIGALEQPQEVTDELLLEAATYASEREQRWSSDDLHAARTAVDYNVTGPWSSLVRAYVAGALRKARKA
jgi:hypothetical protein